MRTLLSFPVLAGLRFAALSGLLSAACTNGTPGAKLAQGMAQHIAVSPGRAAAFLIDVAHPDDRAVPDDVLAGDLWLASFEGKGGAQKVGAGVPTSDGAFSFSRSGDALAYLAAYRFRAGAGELWVATAAGGGQKVSAEATAFAWAPNESALAWVAPGKIGILKAGFSETISAPAGGAQSLLWSPDGKRLAVRSAAAAGGHLWIVDAQTGAKKELAPATSDFAFAPDGALAALGPPAKGGGDRQLLLEDGAGAPRALARATAFAFSPDGKDLALLSTEKKPGEVTGTLSRIVRPAGEPRVLGQTVSDWRFTPSGDLVFLAGFDLRARAGVLTFAPEGGEPREIARKVQSFVVQGKRALYLVQAPQKGDYKIELWTADLASQTPPRKIDEGVYGYQLSTDGATLFWKARCAGTARSCSLLRAPIDGSTPPLFLSANVAGFDLSQDGTRILIEQPHRGATRAVDLAAINAMGKPPEQVKPFAIEVDGSSRFADAAGKRVVYATITAGKGAVYLADVP